MKLESPVARYRKDYQAPNYRINSVNLEVYLHETRTKVVNTMTIERVGNQAPLQLDGEHLTLVKVELDGQPLAEGTDFEVDEQSLTIFELPSKGELKITNMVNPSANTAFEGLYKSGSAYCTQCEAEGFRRITYFLDRPDVLSLYTTTVHANKAQYPNLLSNGNPVECGESEGGMHWVKWHDPHPKPCYLFALVAGDFDCLTDEFITQEGRKVGLELYVDKGNKARGTFALTSLKNAMEWDESRFNLIYDLDIYMIVAVDFFNMGAMENKGLNIFNSKYVLADTATATDQDFLNVESVIGHEYFHNWTGNRVTCRDWFQLSLKEGLTVFRDQEFSSDRGMRSVNRVQDARIIRTHQFEEDASPMAHPIRPDQVMEMNNFYTVTVYNKGAEVIRMIHALLGESGFQKGMELYITRHDGQAVTCEDFIQAMEDANEVELGQFRRWYEQAGTPKVTITTEYDAAEQTLTIEMAQATASTPGQPEKMPFHIPMKSELMTQSGAVINAKNWPADGVFQLKSQRQSFVLENVPEDYVFAPLANFSAPVRVDFATPDSHNYFVAIHAQDAYLRWNAVQQTYLDLIKSYVQDSKFRSLDTLAKLIRKLLEEGANNPSIISLLLQLPSEEAVAAEYEVIPVEAIANALRELKTFIAVTFKSEILVLWERLSRNPEAFDSTAISHRMLANVLMSYIAMSDSDESNEILSTQFNQTGNMTLSFGALSAAVHAGHAIADRLLEDFRTRWSDNTLVMDKWFAVQAGHTEEGALQRVEELLQDQAFDWNKPNRVYALLATFAHNLGQLHHKSGGGYELMKGALLRLNKSNPQVASRLISPLLKWKRLDSERGAKLKSLLVELRNREDLSKDLFEKVDKSLA